MSTKDERERERERERETYLSDFARPPKNRWRDPTVQLRKIGNFSLSTPYKNCTESGAVRRAGSYCNTCAPCPGRVPASALGVAGRQSQADGPGRSGGSTRGRAFLRHPGFMKKKKKCTLEHFLCSTRFAHICTDPARFIF